jgi:uncharacterized protein
MLMTKIKIRVFTLLIFFQSTAFAVDRCAFDVIDAALKKTRGEITSALDIGCVEILANRGDYRMQFVAGRYYEVALKIPDYSKIISWYEKSAKGGSSIAAYNLSSRYYKGEGVKKDEDKYVYWTELAAKRGHVTAQYNLAIIFSSGQGKPKDFSQAKHWFLRAAQQGDVNSQLALAVETINNSAGTQENYRVAKFWLDVASFNGSAEAKELLKTSYQETPHYWEM